MSKERNKTGWSTAFLLFIVFLILKLTNTITWSWWWITAPLWIGFALVLLFIIIGVLVVMIIGVLVVMFIKK